MDNYKTIALTGGTGFLGSHLMAALLKDGHNVIVLGRSTEYESLEKRIAKLLRWFGIEELGNQLEMVEADLMKPRLGLEDEIYNKICAKTRQVIHCASDTSFAERKRESVFKSNVDSLRSILEFTKDANNGASYAKPFIYISTAYVAGSNINNAEVLTSDLRLAVNGYLNVYEESKARAEYIISSYCDMNFIPVSIIRPSIVYGDSSTGRSLKFNALYFPLQSLKCIRDIYLNDINNHGGKKSQQPGIYIDDEGYLFLPLRIYLPHEGALNLIPVDYFVNATMKIIHSETRHGLSLQRVYHLTNNSHTKLELISTYNQRLMKMKGVEIIYGDSSDNMLRNPAEELFDRFIIPYRPYLSDNRIFERVNTDLATGNVQPPEFSYEIFKKCMEYAISVNWGEKVFST